MFVIVIFVDAIERYLRLFTMQVKILCEFQELSIF